MRPLWSRALAALAAVLTRTPAVQAQNVPQPAPGAPACENSHQFAATDCTLTWHGITIYGAFDVGLGWVSHGIPVNPYNYEGESLINRNGNQSRFLIAPNNLSQTGFGIRGRE